MLPLDHLTFGGPMIRRLLLALTLAGATLTGALASPAAAATPVVGSCHRLTYAQALNDTSDDAPAVPCTGRHTTQTVAVVTSSTSFTGLTTDQLAQQANTLCDAPVRKALGPTLLRVQTAYTAWDFVPTSAQIAAGESWVRCDIALVNGPALQQLPRHVLRRPLAKAPITDNIRQCLAGKVITTCNHRHTQRTVGAFAPVHPFPSTAAFTKAAHRKCPGANTYSFPSAAAWSSGYHVIVCFQNTRR